MSQSVNTQYEQEIRFAVVLYGGVSLAIYMNGVAQELLRMVRGTAPLPDDITLEGSERVYREIGQILGSDGPSSGSVDPDDTDKHPIRSRFVVDIISGTSAGGINGVALAKALALQCPNLDNLRETWMTEAQLDLLLNDKESDFAKYPRRKNMASLLNSERMFGLILRTLSSMNKDASIEHDVKLADKLDLFVTATDLMGEEVPIQLTNQEITERVHKAVFHFEYPSPDGTNQFDSDHDPMLAFAARCTSSFPVAFEPMQFDQIANQIMAQQGLTLDEAQRKFEDFFPTYRGKPEFHFSTRQFADGGYLDKRPFSYVTDLIQYRAASGPTKRKLLFVDPFPELPGQKSILEGNVNFIDNALLAAMTLPRYEVIRGDIQAINDYNRRLERLSALRERDDIDRKTLAPSPKPRLAKDDFESFDLKQLVDVFGEGYPHYHHLRVYDVSDMLACLFTRMSDFEPESDEYTFLRLIIRAWRDANYEAYATSEGKATENAFLVHYDLDFRLRRLNHLRASIDGKLANTSLTAGAKKTLAEIREGAELQLGRLRDLERDLQTPSRSPLLENEALRNAVDELKVSLSRHFVAVMSNTTYADRRQAAWTTYHIPPLKERIDLILNELRTHLKGVFDKNRAEIQALMQGTAKSGRSKAVAEIQDTFVDFHRHDFLSLPFLEGSGVKEHASIEVYRVSPADSELSTHDVKQQADKLVGTAVGAFGGFLKRDWREHDMMWGRLDGAERIIMALLPEPKHTQLRQHYIREAQNAILADEFDPDKGDRVYKWLASKLHAERVSDASVDDLLARGDKLLDLFPGLNETIKRRDFRTFLLTNYSSPPGPDADSVAGWIGRSLKIVSEMLDDLPGDDLASKVGPRVARASRSVGSLLLNFLNFATPGSLGEKFARHWLTFTALVGGVLIAVGLLVSEMNTGWIGYGILLACLAIWLIARAFGNWIKGNEPFKHPVKTAAFVLVAILIPLGTWKLWDLLRECLT